MIVRKNKGYETNSMFPNENWYENEPDNYVIDETTEEGKALADKIKRLYPYYDLVLDADGQLVDVVEVPHEVPPPPETLDKKLARLEAENETLKSQNSEIILTLVMNDLM